MHVNTHLRKYKQSEGRAAQGALSKARRPRRRPQADVPPSVPRRGKSSTQRRPRARARGPGAAAAEVLTGRFRGLDTARARGRGPPSPPSWPRSRCVRPTLPPHYRHNVGSMCTRVSSPRPHHRLSADARWPRRPADRAPSLQPSRPAPHSRARILAHSQASRTRQGGYEAPPVGSHRERLQALARGASERGWWDAYIGYEAESVGTKPGYAGVIVPHARVRY